MAATMVTNGGGKRSSARRKTPTAKCKTAGATTSSNSPGSSDDASSGSGGSGSSAARGKNANINSSLQPEYNFRPRSIQNRFESEKRRVTKRQPKPKHKPPPLSKYRRKTANARERTRMTEINNAFEALRRVVPQLPADEMEAIVGTSGGDDDGSDAGGKLTKITTLRLAMNYIRALGQILQQGADQNSCSIDPITQPAPPPALHHSGIDCVMSTPSSHQSTTTYGHPTSGLTPVTYHGARLRSDLIDDVATTFVAGRTRNNFNQSSIMATSGHDVASGVATSHPYSVPTFISGVPMNGLDVSGPLINYAHNHLDHHHHQNNNHHNNHMTTLEDEDFHVLPLCHLSTVSSDECGNLLHDAGGVGNGDNDTDHIQLWGLLSGECVDDSAPSSSELDLDLSCHLGALSDGDESSSLGSVRSSIMDPLVAGFPGLLHSPVGFDVLLESDGESLQLSQ